MASPDVSLGDPGRPGTIARVPAPRAGGGIFLPPIDRLYNHIYIRRYESGHRVLPAPGRRGAAADPPPPGEGAAQRERAHLDPGDRSAGRLAAPPPPQGGRPRPGGARPGLDLLRPGFLPGRPRPGLGP